MSGPRLAPPLLAVALLTLVSAAAAPQSQPLPTLAPLVSQSRSAVVNVSVRSESMNAPPEFNEFFERFFGTPPEGPQLQQGAGSGFLIDPSGLVVTNNHVVEQAQSIQVLLDDGRKFEAEVLGRDPLTDLALLKLQDVQGPLPVLELGDSDAMRVGDFVVAIGNPFGLSSSVSLGIVSARARDINIGPFDDFLQTDAAINPGNSGGPLLNLEGKVVGINTAIVGGGTSIGFAIPVNLAKQLIPTLKRGERIQRGWLGVYVQDLTTEVAKALGVPARTGAVVTDVPLRSPGERGGLQVDDVIVSLNGNLVESARALTRSVGSLQPGQKVELGLFRDRKRMTVSVPLGVRPQEPLAQAPPPKEEESAGKNLGLGITDVDPHVAAQLGIRPEGALVVSVEPSSPAERGGLEPGMVIVEAGGARIRAAKDLAGALSKARSGESVLLRIQLSDGRLLRAITIP